MGTETDEDGLSGGPVNFSLASTCFDKLKLRSFPSSREFYCRHSRMPATSLLITAIERDTDGPRWTKDMNIIIAAAHIAPEATTELESDDELP